MVEYCEELSNGLSCLVDWLSFTVTVHKRFGEILSLFGFDFTDFFESDKGSMGYKRMLLYRGANIRVLFEGNDNMGVHFDVSGSAIGVFLDHYRDGISEVTPWDTLAVDMDLHVMNHMLARVMDVGHFTRLDLAVDNKGDIYFRLSELVRILNKLRFISKFRSWREVCEKRTSGEVIGHTLYFGSRSSSVMLRVYDKQLEQNAKCADRPVMSEWVRWELELKDDRAQLAAQHLISGMSVGQVCIGVLGNYLRIINFDDSNKSRCSSDIKWIRFTEDISRLRLYVPHGCLSLEDKKNWILRQVAPTLTGIIISDYGDLSFLLNHLDIHAGRMHKDLRALVSEAFPEWEAALADYMNKTETVLQQ